MAETHWHYLRLEDRTEDELVAVAFGHEADLTHQQAHALMQGLLDQLACDDASIAHLAETWRAGAPDDTVATTQFIWAITECSGPPCEPTAIAYAEDIAAVMRSAGVDVGVAQPTTFRF